MGQPQTDLKALLQQNGQPEAVPEAKTEPNRKSPVAPSREGKVAIQGHFSKQTHDQLRILGIETRTPAPLYRGAGCCCWRNRKEVKL